MDKPQFFHSAWVSLLFTLLLVATGCDNTIEPFAERGAYSIYGVLSSSQSQQLIRVKPLDVPISKIDSNALDATVTLENVTDGTSETLEDSVIAFSDAESTVLTHNYFTDSPIRPETNYRLRIEGPDGRTVEAETVTPTDLDADVAPQQGACLDVFRAVFNRVKDVRHVRAAVEIKLEEFPQPEPWVTMLRRDVIKPADGADVSMTFTPRSVIESLNERVEEDINEPPLPDSLSPFCWRSTLCGLLDSDEIRVRYRYLGPDWYGNVPEDSITYDPLASNDVTNGLGFFGSIRHDVQTTTVDTASFVYTGGRLCSQPPPDS